MFQKPASFAERLKSYLLKSPVKWNLKQADYSISYGGKITSILHKIGVNQSKILVLPGAVSDNSILEKRNLPINSKFLFVGRYERRKGIEELMQVVTAMPDLEISFVGSIPPSKKIKRANIHYYGEVKDVDVLNKILDEHTYLIVPSLSEGMPNVLLEGMSRGLIPLASDVGAVETLIDSTCGFLLKAGDSQSIKENIQCALSLETNEIDAMLNLAMNKVRSTFAWSELIVKTLENFHVVIEKD
jgi:glycosyltransferase involved in cell wall biosynthesis